MSPVVTICNSILTFNNPTFCPHSVFMCFVWIWEQTAIISLFSINWLVFIDETVCVYCAVRAGSLKVTQVSRCCAEWNRNRDIKRRKTRADCAVRRCCHEIEKDGWWMRRHHKKKWEEKISIQTYHGKGQGSLKYATNKAGVGSSLSSALIAQQPTCLRNMLVWPSICLSDRQLWWSSAQPIRQSVCLWIE